VRSRRISKLRHKQSKQDNNNPQMNFIAYSEASVFYEASYSNDNSLFLSIDGENFFLTDGRYTQEAKAQAKNCEVIEERDIIKSAKEIIKKKRISKLFIDPSEWTLEQFSRLERATKIVQRKGLLREKRAIKTPLEIEKLRESVKIGTEAFDEFARFICAEGIGKSEQELFWQAKSILSGRGKRELSFEPIVAIDENGSLPHARPTDKTLKNGSSLLFDAGVRVDGYCSDRTRTAFVGENTSFEIAQKYKNAELQKIYDTALKAHDEAIKQAKVGMKASELDGIARKIIGEAGYGKQFIHSLGHGVGIEIHEYPTISTRSDTILQEGMIFTIEPGIYIEGLVGVRIEDMVVLTSDGAQIL
jgi:Xaa-Pro aminopeptidase